MATSSITANFRIDNPKMAKAFVNALCSDSAREPNLPRVMETHFESPKAERDFFMREPYSTGARHR